MSLVTPTGFVNYDESFRSEPPDTMPRVRREERVFSGGAPKGRKKVEGKRRVLWTALFTASGCYVVGWLSELLR